MDEHGQETRTSTDGGRWWERAADFLERKEAERHPQITQITQIARAGTEARFLTAFGMTEEGARKN